MKSDSTIKYTSDSKIFNPFENKIEEIGRIKPKKFHYECDGKGNTKWQEIIPFDDKIRRLDKLYRDDIITKESYEKKKQEILDSI
jgi:hypothetical protein